MSVGIISGSVLALQKKKKQEEPSPTPTETDMRVSQSKAYEEANKRLAGETYAPPSTNFAGQSWSGYGYPEYEKKYGVPELPKGAVISKVTETPDKSLSIEYMMPRNPSLSEQLMTFETTPIAQRLGLPSTKPLEMFKRPQDVRSHPLAVLGGVLSPFETIGYVVARMVGAKTPDLPPSAFDLETMRKYPEYTFGNIEGNILLLLGGSYAIEKIASGVGTVAQFVESKTGIAQKLKTSVLGEWYYGTKEKLPVNPVKFKGSDAEMFLIERVPAYREYASKGISEGWVDVPIPESVPTSQLTSASERAMFNAQFGEMPDEYLAMGKVLRTPVEKWAMVGMRNYNVMPSEYLSPVRSPILTSQELALGEQDVFMKAMNLRPDKTPDVLGSFSKNKWTSRAEQNALSLGENLYGSNKYIARPTFLKGMEAERLGMSFANVKRTGILDPEMANVLDNPITRKLYSTPEGLPYASPFAESITRTSMLPKILTTGAIVGAQLLPNARAKASLKVAPLSKQDRALYQPSRTDLRERNDTIAMVNALTGLDTAQTQKQRVSPIVASVPSMPNVFDVPNIPRSYVSSLPRVPPDLLGLPRVYSRGRRKGRRSLYGMGERYWNIATAPEMAKQMLGLGKNVRTKKKKKKR